jgi:hypothetical protein
MNLKKLKQLYNAVERTESQSIQAQKKFLEAMGWKGLETKDAWIKAGENHPRSRAEALWIARQDFIFLKNERIVRARALARHPPKKRIRHRKTPPTPKALDNSEPTDSVLP